MVGNISEEFLIFLKVVSVVLPVIHNWNQTMCE